MLLKRIYDHSSGEPVLDHVVVIRAGDEQHFSTGLVEAAVMEDWMTLGGGRLMLKTKPKLSYRIKRMPGYYCCHCGESQPGALEAQAHVAADHGKKKSPNPENPSGYERILYYDCVKEG